MNVKQIVTYSVILLLTVGISACSDSGSSGGDDQGDPPSIPDIAVQAQPDVSFFQQNMAGKVAAYNLAELAKLSPENLLDGPQSDLISSTNAYGNASLTVMSSSAFGSIFSSFVTFVEEASDEDPNYNTGTWEWTYSQTFEGTTGTYRLTAENSGGSTTWNLYISYDDGQISYNDLNMISGTVKNDGSSGRWEFRLPDDQGNNKLFLSSEWTAPSDTEKNIDMIVYDNTGAAMTTISFEKNEPEFMMTFDYADQSSSGPEYEVYWNTNSSIGYIFIADGDPPKQCWDGSLQDVSCSDVGL